MLVRQISGNIVKIESRNKSYQTQKSIRKKVSELQKKKPDKKTNQTKTNNNNKNKMFSPLSL